MLQAPLQWGCHIHGVAKGRLCSCLQVLEQIDQAITHALPGCSLYEPILQVESDVQGPGLTPRGCGFCQCNLQTSSFRCRYEVFHLLTHRRAGDDTKASEKIEKDVKEFSLKFEKNLPFLIFQLPFKDPLLKCKWHKKNAMTVTLTMVLIKVLFSETYCSVTSTHLCTRKSFSSIVNSKWKYLIFPKPSRRLTAFPLRCSFGGIFRGFEAG